MNKWDTERNLTFLIEWLQEDEDNIYLLPEELVAEMKQLISGHVPPVCGDNEETVKFVSEYGGFCRDCADTHLESICDSSGLPCDQPTREQAIRHTIRALEYGVNNGYLRRKPV